jgi:hypothetical protein
MNPYRPNTERGLAALYLLKVWVVVLIGAAALLYVIHALSGAE